MVAYAGNPRVSVRNLHRECSHYRNREATRRLISDARKEQVIIGPWIWCNTGIDVEVHHDIDDPLLFVEQKKGDPRVTYIMALIGDPSVIVFKTGASILTYGESIIPTYPSQRTIESIQLTEKGKLPVDRYPHGWDDLDWQVYHEMRDPSASFVKSGKNLGVSWHTVKNRFENIVKDCKSWVTFLPRGYNNYQQTVLLFKTEYEVGLRDELRKVDRTSILYKFGDTIMLQLFMDYALQNLFFYKLKREGLIHDLKVSIPIGWCSSV
jgi:hypothetical protein